MNRFLLFFTLSVISLYSSGQDGAHLLYRYIETAKRNSPLINDYRNSIEIERAEQERLKAVYLHSQLELNGDYLLVPIISKDGGRTSFKFNAQDAADYYGYDLGESSGHLHAGVTLTQPLLGRAPYKAAREQSQINMETARYNIRLEEHLLERMVTEQYLLCLLDLTQATFADSIDMLLERKAETVRKLADCGMAKQSDLRLIAIEQSANDELRCSYLQSFHAHLMELNTICGISDTNDILLPDIDIGPCLPATDGESLFTEQYVHDSLNVDASWRSFNLKYKPRLDLFVDGGMQAGAFSEWYRHFGLSAGLTLSWTIADGGQKKWKKRQSELRQHTISTYKANAANERDMRLKQSLAELGRFERRLDAMAKRIGEYDGILSDYSKEMEAGQVSVLDYMQLLHDRIQAERDRLLLQANRKLIIVTYNYWNH